MNNEWLSVENAARTAHYHPETIRDLLRNGEIKGEKFVTVWRVNKTSLLEYLKKQSAIGRRRGPKRKRLDN